MRAMRIFGPIRPHDLAKKFGYKESAPIMDSILSLYRAGLLTKTGKGKTTKYDVESSHKNI